MEVDFVNLNVDSSGIDNGQTATLRATEDRQVRKIHHVFDVSGASTDTGYDLQVGFRAEFVPGVASGAGPDSVTVSQNSGILYSFRWFLNAGAGVQGGTHEQVEFEPGEVVWNDADEIVILAAAPTLGADPLRISVSVYWEPL